MNFPFRELGKQKRLKMMVYGAPKCGKTASIVQFPNAFIIDTEGGTPDYDDELIKNKSQVVNTNDFNTIFDLVQKLKHTNHDFKTFIIDSSTSAVHALRDAWAAKFDKYLDEKDLKRKELEDYGQRYWAKVNGTWARLIRQLETLDMNVIFAAQEKIEYDKDSKHPLKIGVTFDGGKKDDYLFSCIFKIEKRGRKKDAPRVAICLGERAIIGKSKFPDEFVWSYENFCNFYGKEILEKKAEYVKLATEEQLKVIQEYILNCNIPKVRVKDWLFKANVTSFAEMTEKQTNGLIKFLKKSF